MSKEITDVVVYVHSTIASDRENLNNVENIATGFGKIRKYFYDLRSGAFTDAYTHPTYTSRSPGLYKITVDTTGHVSDATAVTGTDLPSHTHDQYIPLTGSDNITGNLKINSAGKGLFLKDKNSNLYPGIVDNGTNLWIGSGATSSTHHVGNTYISAGYNSTTETGNSTIFISVPNATNDGGTNYNVLHDGNTSFTQTVTSSDTGAYQIGTIKINGSDTILYGKDTDTDTKVNMIARGTTKAYLLGTTTSPTSSNQAVTSVAETGVYFDTTAGELHATTFEGNLSGNIDHTDTDPTTAAGYGLTFHPDAGTTGAKALRTNGAVRVMLYNNATTGGYARLTLGNNTASTSGGKNGIIQLYGESANRYCTLTCTDSKSLIFDQDAQTSGTNFSPATTETYDLGTSSRKWRNVYSDTLNGHTLNLYDGTKYSYFVASARSTSSSEPPHVLFGSSIDGAAFVPYGAQTHDLGLIDQKWRNVYATTLYGNLDPSNLSSAVSVDKGGTGRTTLTSNAIIAGNGTSNVNMITTASGALYATQTNGAAQFGTLPVQQGGTGATSAANARTNLGLGTAAVKDSTTSITLGNTDLITSGAVYTAIELDTSVSLTSSVGTVSKHAYYSAATKVCTFVLQLKLTSAIDASSSTTTIATIGKNPTYVCPVVAIDGSNNGLVARVDNSGNIQLCKNAAIASGSTIRVSGSFPVA